MAEKTLGELGEDVATAYLKSKRYRILDRNWEILGRSGKKIGEIDIIAKRKRRVYIVEVKSGKTPDPAWRPEVHMTESKIHKIARTAEVWLTKNGGLAQQWQIDLIAVDFSKDPPSVRHYCHVGPDGQ